MENIFMALTNLPIILPLTISFNHNDFTTFSFLLFVGTFSFLSHLVENHKHGMPGIGFSAKTSYILNRLDVIGCIIMVARFAYILYEKYVITHSISIPKSLVNLLVTLCAYNIISEYDKYNPKLKKRYIFIHSIWHLGIYIWMYLFLNNFVY